MDGAVQKIKSRVEELQGQLAGNKIKKSKRGNVELELKHLIEQAASAQHDIDANQGKTQQLLSQKENLSNKVNAKKQSLAKFKSGAL